CSSFDLPSFPTRRSSDLAVLLILLHFVLPFLMLLSRDVKHNPRTLATVAALVLGIHLVDLYWVVVPGALPRQAGDPPLRLHWMEDRKSTRLNSSHVKISY